MRLEDLDAVEPAAACDFFNESFCNPAAFTICLTGNVDVRSVLG